MPLPSGSQQPAATPPDEAVARATELGRHFWPDGETAGITAIDSRLVPQPARGLLDHRSHMTVAMERHHGAEMRLRVVNTVDSRETSGGRYVREILLEKPDGKVVQYGIVRIDLGAVDDATAAAIRAGRRPLGRILIDAGVLRDVQRVALLAIHAGPRLAGLFKAPAAVGSAVYGRVADIRLNGRPAVELLEIVAPG